MQHDGAGSGGGEKASPHIDTHSGHRPTHQVFGASDGLQPTSDGKHAKILICIFSFHSVSLVLDSQRLSQRLQAESG